MIAYCTNVHPAEDLAGHPRPARPVRGRACASALGADMLGLGLWLPAPVARGLAEDRDRAARAAGRARRARGLTVGTLNALPVRRVPREVVKHAVYQPDWTDPRRLAYTVDWPPCSRTCCPTPRPTAASRRCRWPGASRGPSRRRRARRGRARPSWTGSLRAESADGRPIRLAVEPEPGCVVDTVADAVGWLAGRVDPDQSGSAWTPATSRCRSPTRRRRSRRSARPGCRWSRCRCPRRWRSPNPAREEGRRAVAAYAEPRFLHQVRENTPGGVLAADDLPEAFDDPARRGTRGGCTSTCRCTPQPAPLALDHGRAARPPWRPVDARHRTSRSRPTPGTCCRGRRRDLADGHRRRAALGRANTSGRERRRETAGGPRRRRHDAGAARAHAQPRRSALGWQAELGTVLPAVTCSAQATLLTGLTPAEHGIVGNGWYFRDLGEVHLWRQHNRLVGGEKLWETARRVAPRLHGREHLLVVRDGRRPRTSPSPRGRSTTPTAASRPTATSARPSCTTGSPEPSASSRCSSTGARPRPWRPASGSSARR